MRNAVLAASLVLGSAAAAWADCDATAQRQASLSLEGVTSVEIIAKAGSLKVYGRSGSNAIKAHGTACASTRSSLDDVTLRAEKRGNVARIEVDTPEIMMFWNEARLDLTVELPDRLPIHISDGSGSMDVENVASVRIEDGSGDIDVQHVTGNVFIADGSGSIEVEDVGGDVKITDGSGEIVIDRVRGSVEIPADGSGSIEISDVGGSVNIGTDGSGSIDIEKVRHDVTIGNDGSGSISVADVTGDFTVRNDGSGGIHIERVTGHVSMPREHD
ncbi:MAG TPA: hypothetical protein VIL97_01510 [Thermoanaerobaculia bacterium]